MNLALTKVDQFSDKPAFRMCVCVRVFVVVQFAYLDRYSFEKPGLIPRKTTLFGKWRMLSGNGFMTRPLRIAPRLLVITWVVTVEGGHCTLQGMELK